MFTSLMEKKVPEQSGPSLWEQCFLALDHAKSSKSFGTEDVDHLVILVSKDVHGDFNTAINEIINDPINGFLEELPWR